MMCFHIRTFGVKKKVSTCLLLLVFAYATFASELSATASTSGLILFNAQSKQEVLSVDATLSSSCTNWKLWGDKVALDGRMPALQRYFVTADNALLAEHMAILRKDGTFEGTLRSIKSSEDLRDSFRNVLEVKCLYALKTPKIELFRIAQKLRLPNGQVLLQKFVLAEVCGDKFNCQITNRFFKSEAVDFLFQLVDEIVQKERVVRVGFKTENAIDSVKGDFYLLKSERNFDFQIRFALELNALRMPLQTALSDRKELSDSFYLSPLGDSPLMMHRSIFTKQLSQQLLIHSIHELRLPRLLSDTRIPSVVRFSNSGLSVWAVPICAAGKCDFLGFEETVTWKLLSTIRFLRD